MAKTSRTNLTVPYFAQEKSLSCGIAALRMVLATLGDSATEKELLKEVKLHSFGTFSTDLGYIALKRGHKVCCWTMYMPLSFLNLPLGTNITLEMLGGIKIPARAKMTVQSWTGYLQAGGELIWNLPTLDQLKPAYIISVNLALLGRFWKNWDSGHYVVINTIGKYQTKVLDPEIGEISLNNDLLLTTWTVNGIRSSNYLMRVLG